VTWQDLVQRFAVFRTEYDGSAHLAADAMLACSLQDDGLRHWEDGSRKITSEAICGPRHLSPEEFDHFQKFSRAETANDPQAAIILF
jgi:hypothetical protein